MKELIKELNELGITQQDLDWGESLPSRIYEEHFKNAREVSTGLDVNKHRWYETSITVIEVGGMYIGIRHVSDLFSESMCVDDVYHKMKFMEMEEIKLISYREKRN